SLAGCYFWLELQWLGEKRQSNHPNHFLLKYWLSQHNTLHGCSLSTPIGRTSAAIAPFFDTKTRVLKFALSAHCHHGTGAIIQTERASPRFELKNQCHQWPNNFPKLADDHAAAKGLVAHKWPALYRCRRRQSNSGYA